MKIDKLFTDGKTDCYGVSFKISNSDIKSTDGRSLFKSIDVEVPDTWSQISIDILVQKYFRKNSVPACLKKVQEKGIPEWLQRSEADKDALLNLPENERYIGEVSVKQVFRRIAGGWTYWGYKLGYFDDENSAKNFFSEIQYILCNQIAAPNSPQWFNTGLHWAYGIDSEAQGHYFFDEQLQEIIPSKSAYERPQPHACFIQSISDNLVNSNGIMELVLKESRLFKYGSGTGTNFSTIRGKGESLSGGGRSSGVMSFLKVGDVAAGAIKSGGITRRAAKMVILDVDHPDVEDFISWKLKEEQKVVSLITGSKINHKVLELILKSCEVYQSDSKLSENDRFNIELNKKLYRALSIAKALMVPEKFVDRVMQLAKQGVFTLDFATFSTAWDSESYYTVSGQNSNNSVSVTNNFLYSVENDEDWQLINRVDKSVAKSVKASDIWNKIVYSAWSCADPGLQYSDTINQWHTCPVEGAIRASNPCSEYLFLDDTACNLASINLIRFRKSDGSFDTDTFEFVIRLFILALEISVAMAQFPSQRIAYLSYKYRTLGLGYANIGAYLMSIGIPYDSEEGRNICAAITSILTAVAYSVSSEIAKEKGTFLGYQDNSENMLRVIRNHRRAAYSLVDEYEGLAIKPIALNTNLLKDYNLANKARTSWDVALLLAKRHGFRNAQVTCIAPTGTIGLLMDCSTTGIEPDFSIIKYKNLAGGGYFKIINNTVTMGLKYLGYSTHDLEKIINYIIGHKTIKEAPYINHNTLKAKGFSESEITKIETALPNIFNIEFAFNTHILGEDFCSNVLGIELDKLKNPNFSLLQAIGFSREQITDANIYLTGSMGVEGCDLIKEEHLAVFDCANICGVRGTRFLSYESHVKMLAAAQSFISGGISKTINMPATATIKDCSEAYKLAWQLGVKAAALYVDGSKLSQPLQSSLLDDDSLSSYDLIQAVFEDKNIDFSLNKDTVQSSYDKTLKVATYGATNVFRERPSNKRKGYTQKAKLANHKIYIHTGEYEDGRLAEIFLDVYKEGVAFRGLMNSFAIAISIGLQYGVPLEEFVEAFTFTKFDPSGIVDGHDNIRMATSMVDYIFRDLAINYLDRHDLGHVGFNESNEIHPKVGHSELIDNANKNNIKNKIVKSVENKGYEGEICAECHSMTMIRNGTCLVCTTCGTTTGCS